MSENEKTQLELDVEAAEKKATEVNSTRSGIGTRVQVGKTRGKNPIVISYEQFDSSIPESIPKAIQEFVDFTKANETALLSYLIEGYNSAQYTAASDPLAEFVDPSWPDEVQTQFRVVARNYSRGANVPLEDAVALIKPGFVKQFSK